MKPGEAVGAAFGELERVLVGGKHPRHREAGKDKVQFVRARDARPKMVAVRGREGSLRNGTIGIRKRAGYHEGRNHRPNLIGKLVGILARSTSETVALQAFRTGDLPCNAVFVHRNRGILVCARAGEVGGGVGLHRRARVAHFDLKRIASHRDSLGESGNRKGAVRCEISAEL